MLHQTRLEVALDDAIELSEAAPPFRGRNIAVDTTGGDDRDRVGDARDGR